MGVIERRSLLVAGMWAVFLAGAAPAVAQDARSVLPPGWHVRHVKTIGRRESISSAATNERSLTVRKPFAPLPDGTFSEGGIVYGDIAAFVPEPRIDSGVQFPYGSDGIGGYGSDIGLGTSDDSDVYDRGALDQPRTVRVGNE